MILKSIWMWLWGAIVTFIFSSITLVGSFVGAKPSLYWWTARNWGRWILGGTLQPVEVQGMENVRMDRPQIIASNHQSWYDVFALAAVVPKKFRFVAKEELGRIPVFGRAWNASGHISVNRSDRMQAVRTLTHFGEVVRKDNSAIVIFPEGTRSAEGVLLPFKKGAFMLALTTHIDIVPTAVIGGRQLLKKGGWRVGKGRLIVRFGEPIPTVGYTEDNRDDLIALVRERIDKMLTDGEGK